MANRSHMLIQGIKRIGFCAMAQSQRIGVLDSFGNIDSRICDSVGPMRVNAHVLPNTFCKYFDNFMPGQFTMACDQITTARLVLEGEQALGDAIQFGLACWLTT